MNSLSMAWRFLRRDLTSGDLSILTLALLVAVTSMTAVGFFTDRIGRAVSQQAASIYAADLVLRSRRPIVNNYEEQAQQAGLETGRITSFPSVVLLDDTTSLAEIKGVTDTYPLRGTLTITDQIFTPGTPTEATPGPGEAWATSRLMARLGASVGDTINVGQLELKLTEILDTAPDQGWQFTDFAPTLLMNYQDIPRTELIQQGSRVTHRILFAGDPGTIDSLKTRFQEQLAVSEDMRSIANAGPEISNSLTRAKRFLGLASLVSVLLAAVAIAMAANSYAKRHLDTAALMKAFGAEQRFMQNISLYQMGMLSLGAGLFGGLLGFGAQAGLVWLVGDMIGTQLPLPSPRSGYIGFMIALLLLSGFALPSFFQLKRVPPARVLRKDLTPIPLRFFWVVLIALGAVSALSYWLIGDLKLLLYFGLGLLLTLAALVLAGWLLLKALTSLRGSSGVAWRYGLANVARRGRDSILQVVAFGLGLMVLLLLAVVRNDLLQTWQATLPEDAPNYFLINIQPDDVTVAESFFVEQQIETPYFVPLIRARLTEVNQTPVADIQLQNPEGRRFFRRESNLTYRSEPQAGNEVVSGEWWSDNPDIIEVSVEEDFAKDIEVGLGDQLGFDIAGETITAEITSIRRVAWDSFQPNFFMVFAPDALRDFPSTFITSVHLDDTQKPLLVDLVRQLPSVTPIDMDNVLGQVRSFMDKAALAVEYVFMFTIIAGLVVLLAAIQASRGERQFESAILRTLGASRGMVFRGIAVEFVCIGAVAGLLAAIGAGIAGYLVAEQALELDYTTSPWLWLVGLGGGALIVGLSGILATRTVVNHAPMETLRKT